MSNIKEVIRVNNLTDLPATGAARVMYIVKNATQLPSGKSIVKGFYWDASSGYQEIVDPEFIVYSPYANPIYPTLDTVKKALDFLLPNTFSVTFMVTPNEVFSSGQYEVTFSWALSKTVDNIASIVIKRVGTDAVLVSGKQFTSGVFGSKSVTHTINSEASYEITVTDNDGNVVTAQDTILYSENRVTVENLTVNPSVWNRRPVNNTTQVTLTWVLSATKEHVSNVFVSKKIGNGQYGDPINVMTQTNDQGIGTIEFTEDVTADILYKVTVYPLGTASPHSLEELLDFIPYINISFANELSINPTTSSGGLTTFAFTGSLNRTLNTVNGSYLRLYQVDSQGELMVGVDNVFNGGYIDLVPLLVTNAFSVSRNFQITEDVYFEAIANDIDVYDNTSDDSSSVTLPFNLNIELDTLTINPVKDYLGINNYLYGYNFVATFDGILDDTKIEDVEIVCGGIEYDIPNFAVGASTISFAFSEQFTESPTTIFTVNITYNGYVFTKTVNLTMYDVPTITNARVEHSGVEGQISVLGTLSRPLIDGKAISFAGQSYVVSSVLPNTSLNIPVNISDFDFDFANTEDLIITEILTGGRGEYKITSELSFGLYKVTFTATEDGTPVEGITITILNGEILTTDSNGVAVTSPMTDGTYSFIVTGSGYGNSVGSVTIDGADETKAILLAATGTDHTVYFGYMIFGETYNDITIIADPEVAMSALISSEAVIMGQESLDTNTIDPVTVVYPALDELTQWAYMFIVSEEDGYIGYNYNSYFNNFVIDSSWMFGEEYTKVIGGKTYYLYLAKVLTVGSGETQSCTFSSVTV